VDGIDPELTRFGLQGVGAELAMERQEKGDGMGGDLLHAVVRNA